MPGLRSAAAFELASEDEPPTAIAGRTRPGAQAPRFQARAAGSVGGGVDETSRHVAALGPAFKANCDEGAVELRLRNDADIDPYIVATNADIPEFDAYSQAASMKKRARWAQRVLAT